ncbi:MAG: D-2-hydroxyacid dehydrogenase [Clostridia bacterium]|nr:D-2-hydroxyacid dehydrogenase [Clostridia bacterium]
MSTIAILKDCKEAEKAMILSACQPQDNILFFDDDASMLSSQCAGDIEIIFGEPDVDTVNALPRLRWIQMTWAGANKYTSSPDYPAAVVLTSASGAFGGVISEHIMAGILALYKNLRAYRNQLMQGDWQLLSGDDSIEGKRALILGMGDIGTHTARKLQAFGAVTVGICRSARTSAEYFDECCDISRLDEQLQNADLIISALPGTNETRGLINSARIAKMNKTAIFANVGRGFVVDTEALTQALQQGRLRGAALDVTDPEPLPCTHPLRSMDNVILTPHVSGISWGENDLTRRKIINIFTDNLRRDANGGQLLHRIDLARGY